MSDNLKIYVCCHKDYEDVGINNNNYKLISNKDIQNNTSLELIKTDKVLDDRMWSELSCIYHIWKHPELQSDWIGICHYRRYFDFMNYIPTNLTKPIVPKRLSAMLNNYITYDLCHNSVDLYTCIKIIKQDFSDYLRPMLTMCDSHQYFPYNMFILPKSLFNELCEFIFGVLFKFDAVIKVNNKYDEMLKHIADYRERYVEKSSYPNDTYEYQARLYGFLAERLVTAFFLKYLHDNGADSLEEKEVTITEKTYNKI